MRSRIRRGQFGDDAWFTAKFRTAEVIGERWGDARRALTFYNRIPGGTLPFAALRVSLLSLSNSVYS